MENIQLTLFGKTSPEHSVQIKEKISGEFSKKSQKPRFHYLKAESGQKTEWSSYQTVQSLGESWTPNIGVFPNAARESTLSQILEVNAPQKYYLSPKACRGILRRAEKRGKELPPLLKAALEAQANGKFLVTDTSDYQSAGFISRASAEAYSIGYEEEMSATLRSGLVPDVMQAEILDMTHANDVIRESGDVCPTLQARMGTGGNQIPLVFELKNNVKCLTPWNCQSKRIFDVYGAYPCLQAMDSGGANNTTVLTIDPTYCIQGNTIERSDTAGANGKGVIEGESYTLNTVDHHAVCHSVGFCPNNSSTAAGLSEESELTPTLSTTKNVGVFYTPIDLIYAIDRAAFNQGENAKYDFQIDDDGVNSTIVARGPSAILDCRLSVWIVRRFTPRECERLQGFLDDGTMYDTEGNELKDTPRYKALGNSIAIPCALMVFQGILEAEAAS